MDKPMSGPVVVFGFVTYALGLLTAWLAGAVMMFSEPSSPPAPTPAVATDTELAIEIQGSKAVEIGETAVLRAVGNFDRCGWISEQPINKFDGGLTATFSTARPGVYRFYLYGAKCGGTVLSGDTYWDVVVGTPDPVKPDPDPVKPEPPVVKPDPTRRALRATYVYEQRQGSVPPAVAAALSELNVQGLVASPIDQGVLNGKGQIPAQYAVALDAAKKAGIPCLVVEFSAGAPRIVPKPTTKAQVLEAVLP